MSRFSRKLRMVREERQKVVSILTPAGDLVHTEYAASLFALLLHTSSQESSIAKLNMQTYGSSVLPTSRSKLAQSALDVGATHMLWIDSDMTFPNDMLLRFASREEPIIGINAMMRRAPYLNCAQGEPHQPLVTHLHSTGLEKVYRTGFGVMWIASEVFRKIPKPWFETIYQPETDVYRSEDYVFCEKAREAGYEIYIDQDISKQVNHLGSFSYNPLLKAIMAESAAGSL